MPSTRDPNQDRLVELGKKLQDFYDSGYVNKKQAILFAFYKGLASGLGAFLGGTIVIGLLLWIVSLGNHLPFLNHIVTNLRQTLHQ